MRKDCLEQRIVAGTCIHVNIFRAHLAAYMICSCLRLHWDDTTETLLHH